MTQVLVLIGINVAIGFVVPNIDWRAHLGGLITGVARRVRAGLRAGAEPGDRSRWSGIVAIVAGLVLAVLIRDQQITQLVIDQLGGLPTR